MMEKIPFAISSSGFMFGTLFHRPLIAFHRVYIILATSEIPLPYLYLKLACLLKVIKLL